MIVGSESQILAKACDSKEEIIITTIDLADIERVCKEKPVLICHRPELY